jgi:outer membrane protein OmpA-like peptidoglycan-associated protein
MSRQLAALATVLAAVAALSLAACGSAPKRDLDRERIEATLAQLESDASLAPLAATEIARARDAVRDLANAVGINDEARATLAYVAERRIDIAYAAAQAALEESKLQQLEREGDQIRLEASRRDAELTRLEAEKLRVQNLARAEEAERARADTVEALALRDVSALEAQAARAQAQQSQRVARAQAEEAGLARQEAELAMATVDSLRMQMQTLSARREGRGEVMTLGESVFPPGKTMLQPEALANLDRVVEFVNRDPARSVRIEGHTDNSGGANLNQVLSQRRANAVRDALVQRGVDAARMTAIGLGSDAPVAGNDSAEGRARNRRVEIIVEDAR